MIHSLKIDQIYFDVVANGRKTYEIRLNDRNYQEGDGVHLYVPDGKEIIVARIGFITDYEQKEGYVVFSLLNVRLDK